MNDARRAVARWAWRLLRRDWRQQMLTTALLVLAVGAAVTGSGMAVNSQHDGAGFFGDGDTVIRVRADDPATVQAALARAAEAFEVIEPIWHTPLRVPGTNRVVDVRGQLPGGPLAGSKLRLLDGRFPQAPGEAAVTRAAGGLFDVAVGGTVDLAGSTATVVGVVEDPTQLDDEFVLVPPDATAPAAFVSILAVGGHGDPTASALDGQDALIRRDDAADPGTAVIVIVAITLLLALVGLIAAAGFVVVARRRQRQLGLLAAVGGSPGHLRLVMVANGCAVGVVAAAAGTLAGIVGWQLARPVTEQAAGRRLGGLDLPWPIVAVTAALAVVIATLAAWWPACHVSRLPVMAALSGRPARPRPVHRSVLVALAIMAGGVGLVVLGVPSFDDANPVLLSLGLVAVVAGVVLVTPAAVRILALVAPRLPLAPRLALRDLTRYQSRSAASLASITLGLGIAVAIIAVTAASATPATEGNLAPSQLLVQPIDHGAVFDPGRTAADDQQFDDQAAAVVAALGPGVAAVPLDVVVDRATHRPIGVGKPIDEHTLEHLGWAYVATTAVLAHVGIDPTTIEPGVDLLIAQDRDVLLVHEGVRPEPVETPPVTQVVDLPVYSSAPFALVTEAAMKRYGWEPARASWLVESPAPLTDDEATSARTAAEAAGVAVVTRDDQDTLVAIRRWTTVAGIGLALAVVAMAVGLMRGESARDLRTLTATGATSRTRRTLTASTAAALATLGSVLAVIGAYVFLMATYRSDLSQLRPVPIGDLLAVMVGLPILATGAGWLLAGREPRSFARQALD